MKSNTDVAKQSINTEQLLLRPRSEFVERLRKAAAEYGYESGNQVAVEILQTYFEFWLEIKNAERAALEAQRQSALGKAQTAQPYERRRKNQ